MKYPNLTSLRLYDDREANLRYYNDGEANPNFFASTTTYFFGPVFGRLRDDNVGRYRH